LDLLYPDQIIVIPISVAQLSPTFNNYIPLEGYKKHVFKKGETLYGTMVRNYKVPKSIFFESCYPLIKKINPEISDFNKIFVGQEVLVTILKQDRKFPRIYKRDLYIKKSMKNSIGKLFNYLGGNFVDKGNIFISIKDGHKIKLNAVKNPLIKTEKSNIILNSKKELLSKEFKESILNLKDYKILDIDRKGDFKQVANALLRQAGYDQVLRKKPVIIGDQITLSITGDWTIIKDISQVPPEIFVINSVEGKRQSISPYLKNYLNKHRLKVVDILSDIDKQESEEVIEKAFNKNINENKVPSKEVLIDSFLDIFKEEVHSNLNSKIFFRSKETMNKPQIVTVDRFLTSKSNNFIINFNDIKEEHKKLFARHHFNFLDIKRKEEPKTIIRDLLNFLQVKLPKKKVEIKSENNPNCQITLKVPGVLINKEEDKLLLTDLKINKDISSYLFEKGITVIEY
jgi:hypothetical protein